MNKGWSVTKDGVLFGVWDFYSGAERAACEAAGVSSFPAAGPAIDANGGKWEINEYKPVG